jgi:drug/metabolite transporter (DMT)-like permease
MGAFAFSRWRLAFACADAMGPWRFVTGSWRSLQLDGVGVLALSGFIGIFVGDTALFACMNRLGPRRSGILFATHALFSVVLAWLFLGETLSPWALVGSALLIAGVMTAIAFGRRDTESHQWEATKGRLVGRHRPGLVVCAGAVGGCTLDAQAAYGDRAWTR